MNMKQKYIAQLIAMHSRGKNLEEGLRLKQLFARDLMPSQLTSKIATAQEAKHLYIKARRLCALLLGMGNDNIKTDLEYWNHIITSSLRRIDDVLTILNDRAQKWGFDEKPSELQDNNVADDADEDRLRQEIKSAIHDLANILDYMEAPSLKRIQHELNKIIG